MNPQIQNVPIPEKKIEQKRYEPVPVSFVNKPNYSETQVGYTSSINPQSHQISPPPPAPYAQPLPYNIPSNRPQSVGKIIPSMDGLGNSNNNFSNFESFAPKSKIDIESSQIAKKLDYSKDTKEPFPSYDFNKYLTKYGLSGVSSNSNNSNQYANNQPSYWQNSGFNINTYNYKNDNKKNEFERDRKQNSLPKRSSLERKYS